MVDITSLNLNALVKGIRNRELKCAEIAEKFIENIEKKKDLNALIYFNKKQVLDEAHVLDGEADNGKFKGRLHGVPLLVKDNIHIKGITNTAGSPALKDFVPIEDAPVIEKLRKEGALFIGKTNMHELAFGVTTDNKTYGRCRNSQAFDYSAGGSSGGNGSAIGAKMAPAALGTDTGGSVRIPSSVNGTCGLRPTINRYNSDGVTPISYVRDTIGPMGKCVEDLILLDEIITDQKYLPSKNENILNGLRLGVSNYLCGNLDSEVSEVFEKAKKILVEAGVELVNVDFEKIEVLNKDCGFKLLFYGPKVDMAHYLKKYNINLNLSELIDKITSDDVKKIYLQIKESNIITEKDYNDTIEITRENLIQSYKDLFTESNIKALIFPTLFRLPVRSDNIDENTLAEFIRNTDPGSNAGLPGISIPMGRSKTNNLPIGLAFDCLQNDDHLLLEIALSVQNLLATVKT